MELKKFIEKSSSFLKAFVWGICIIGIITTTHHLWEGVFGFTEFTSGLCTFGLGLAFTGVYITLVQ